MGKIIMDEIVLCSYNESGIEINVRAFIVDGQLKIEGQDIGSRVEAITGDCDYEYWCSLSKLETVKLHQLLKNDSYSNKNLLKLMAMYFSGVEGCTKFKKYCNKNSIHYDFSTYI
jgi:hypothetical protein